MTIENTVQNYFAPFHEKSILGYNNQFITTNFYRHVIPINIILVLIQSTSTHLESATNFAKMLRKHSKSNENNSTQ